MVQTKYNKWLKVKQLPCKVSWFDTLFIVISRKPDIHVPYLYVDMGAAVLCASFMSFGVKRRWFAMAAAVQLAISTYASYVGEQVYYGDWLKVSHRLWCTVRTRQCCCWVACVLLNIEHQSSTPDFPFDYGHCFLIPYQVYIVGRLFLRFVWL